MENSRQRLQRVLVGPCYRHVEYDTFVPGEAGAAAGNERRSRHRGDNVEVAGFAFSNVAVDVIPYFRQFWALLEVFWVVVRVVADVLGRPAA